MTSTSAKDFFDEWQSNLQSLRDDAPDMARAFGGLHIAAMKEGTLTVREKELIALAIGLAKGCTDCIFLHAEGALKAGASREQVIEATGVAVLMEGGPAFVHLPVVFDALDHLKAE